MNVMNNPIFCRKCGAMIQRTAIEKCDEKRCFGCDEPIDYDDLDVPNWGSDIFPDEEEAG